MNNLVPPSQGEDQYLPSQSEVEAAFRLLSEKFHPKKVTIPPFRMLPVVSFLLINHSLYLSIPRTAPSPQRRPSP